MDLQLLGSSPTSVAKPTLLGLPSVGIESCRSKTKPLTLKEFLRELPKQIRLRKESCIKAGSKDDPIMNLFDRLCIHDNDEWKRFAYFDQTKHYTRNLIATDHETYTLLLLCWNAGKQSPIHDHPCDGCWMRVLQGQVQECRYKKDDASGKLVCTRDETFSEGGLVFIEDSLGVHKVGNPAATQPAVTLHLYSPPFQNCKIWLDENRKPCNSCICHYSEYGKKV